MRYIVFTFILIMFCGCKGHSDNECLTHLRSARNLLNVYYKDSVQSHLIEALDESEMGLDCPKTRRGAIETKISLLSLLRKYDEGYRFVDSLSEDDFRLKYKKGMYKNSFLAFKYELLNDSGTRDKYYKIVMTDIQSYIQKQQSNKLDVEAYYDLFFIKQKIYERKAILQEIDSLISKYPNNKDVLKSLINPNAVSDTTNAVRL